MDTDPERLKEMMSFQFHRNIVGLYKKYLNILEDIKKDHTILINKVEEKNGKEFAQNIDYIDAEKYNYYRKKVLDSGNEIYRELESMLEKVDFSLKKK